MPHDNSSLDAIHPDLWRASQLARSSTRCLSTGHLSLDTALPGGGWPTGTMVDAHVKVAGTGELRLLSPVLSAAGKRRVVFVQPPHAPNALALAAMGLHPSQVVWVNPDRTADALWACEQVLKSSGAHMVLFWQNQVRPESLRRLNLASGGHNGLFFMFRPLASAQDPSPAPLRIALSPAIGGIQVEFIKRRGPVSENGLLIPLSPSFVHRHAPVDRPVLAPAPARIVHPELVG